LPAHTAGFLRQLRDVLAGDGKVKFELSVGNRTDTNFEPDLFLGYGEHAQARSRAVANPSALP
jgi:hypothetical protein